MGVRCAGGQSRLKGLRHARLQIAGPGHQLSLVDAMAPLGHLDERHTRAEGQSGQRLEDCPEVDRHDKAAVGSSSRRSTVPDGLSRNPRPR